MNLLVVDDEPLVLRVVKACLERDGYNVETLDTAQSALERIYQDPPLDLIILDLRMPVMDGNQLIQEIINRPLKHQAPIMLLSAYIDDLSKDLRKYLLAVYEKPITCRELRKEVAKALHLQTRDDTGGSVTI